MGKAAKLVEEGIDETLTFYALPDSHWIKIRTNNPLKHIMKEIRSQILLVGALSDRRSCLNLVATKLRHIAGTKWLTRKYVNMAPLCSKKARTT